MKLSGILAATALLATQSPPEPAAVGEPMPNLIFKTVLGGDGRTKLREFRGQPVIVAWYSTVFAGIEAARLACSLEEKHAQDGLVVFLMEIKDHDETYLRALQLAEFPGASSRLIRNQKLYVKYDESLGPPPRLALVGVDGTLRYAGTYGKPSEVKKLVKEELDRRKSGFGDDALARKARAVAFGEGKLGAALLMLGDATEAEQADAAREIGLRFETLKRSVDHHLAEGEPASAVAAAQALIEAAKGHPGWEKEAAETAAALESEQVRAESAREVELAKILEPSRKKAPAKGVDAKLREFAAKSSGTKVGARAERLAAAIAFAANDLK